MLCIVGSAVFIIPNRPQDAAEGDAGRRLKGRISRSRHIHCARSFPERAFADIGETLHIDDIAGHRLAVGFVRMACFPYRPFHIDVSSADVTGQPVVLLRRQLQPYAAGQQAAQQKQRPNPARLPRSRSQEDGCKTGRSPFRHGPAQRICRHDADAEDRHSPQSPIHHIVTLSCSSLYFAGPMPLTFCSSSMPENKPCSSR